MMIITIGLFHIQRAYVAVVTEPRTIFLGHFCLSQITPMEIDTNGFCLLSAGLNPLRLSDAYMRR